MNSAPSSEHSKVEPGWFAEKTKIALSTRLGVAGGLLLMICPAEPEVIVVIGAAMTVKVRVAGVGSAWRARSTARTRKVCSQASRFWTDSGEVQGSYGPKSTAHSKVNSNTGVALSVP